MSKIAIPMSLAAIILSVSSLYNVHGTLNPVAIYDSKKAKKERLMLQEDAIAILNIVSNFTKEWHELNDCSKAALDLETAPLGNYYSDLIVSCDDNVTASVSFVPNPSQEEALSALLLPAQEKIGKRIRLLIVAPASIYIPGVTARTE